MTQTTALLQYNGHCRCTALGWRLQTPHPLQSFTPRACDCDFCQQHGAQWFSDSDASLQISAQSEHDALWLQQGSGQARFLVCAHCNTPIAVLYADASHTPPRLYAALNARTLTAPESLEQRSAASIPHVFAPAQTASPKLLTAEQKATRWKQLWCANVNLEGLQRP